MPSTPGPYHRSGEDSPSSHDELLQRKERALQRSQTRKRIIWDLGVWVLLLPIGGGGFIWAIGHLAESGSTDSFGNFFYMDCGQSQRALLPQSCFCCRQFVVSAGPFLALFYNALLPTGTETAGPSASFRCYDVATAL